MTEAAFLRKLEEVARNLAKYPKEDVFIIHHDEADGLCSASIMKAALERLGFTSRTVCIDKLFPEIVEKLHDKEGGIYVYADIGAGHAQMISSKNQSRNLVIILDHHDTQVTQDPSVYNLNPELYGLRGETEASASTVVYLFAKALDESNMDLAHLAVIGAAEIPGPMRGLNKIALNDAVTRRSVSVNASGTREEIKVLAMGKGLSYRRASTLLSVLGSVGYYRDGPGRGIEACLKGWDKDVERLALQFEEERKRANKRLQNRLYEDGLNQLINLQWFHAGDNFEGMGTKVIGSFCSYLSFQRIVDPMRYLVGMMNASSTIPGFGELSNKYVKVSGRAPRSLSKMIEQNAKPPLSKILPEACESCGGFGDGHTVAASGVVLAGTEERFIKALDELASKNDKP